MDYGLLLSSILATAAVGSWLLYRYRYTLDASVLGWSRRKLLLIQRYRDFPIYNASTSLLDGVRLALPVLFLSRYFPEAVVGYYALTLRVAMAPIGFISSAVSQVNLKKVAELVNQGQPIRPYLVKVTLLLAVVVSPLLIVIILHAPSLFAWVFGEQWRVAGTYLQILMPALALRFVVSTVSSTFGATGHNRLGAIWKITAFVVTLGVFLMAAPRVDITGMFVAVLLTDLVLYSFYYYLAWHAAGHPMGFR
jgi:O-antigen/teichoic acid export membrane protein